MMPRSAATLFVIASSLVSHAGAESFSAGLHITKDVSVGETGMRVYPGATPIDRDSDGDNANVELAFGQYGLKVVVAKLRSSDPPYSVAAFYRNDLARFGEVLDCGAPDAANASRPKDKKSRVLACEGDKPSANGMHYEAGRKDDQHVVDIKSKNGGSEISFVHVRVRTPD